VVSFPALRVFFFNRPPLSVTSFSRGNSAGVPGRDETPSRTLLPDSAQFPCPPQPFLLKPVHSQTPIFSLVFTSPSFRSPLAGPIYLERPSFCGRTCKRSLRVFSFKPKNHFFEPLYGKGPACLPSPQPPIGFVMR